MFLQFSGFTPIDYTSKFQRLHYGAFLFNMEFLDYTQYIDEHNIFDLNALKNTTDTFVSGKQYSYSTSLVFCTASMSSQSHLSRTRRGVGIWWAGWAFANLVYSI